jgi:hypothetical protein
MLRLAEDEGKSLRCPSLFSIQALQETDYWDPTSRWGFLPRFRTELPPRAVARCGSADCNSVMVHG